jgi:hypothetical protein
MLNEKIDSSGWKFQYIMRINNFGDFQIIQLVKNNKFGDVTINLVVKL